MTALRPERGDSADADPEPWEEPSVYWPEDDGGYDGSETIKLRVPEGALPPEPASPAGGPSAAGPSSGPGGAAAGRA